MPSNSTYNLDYVRGELIKRGSDFSKFARKIGKHPSTIRGVVAGTIQSAPIQKALDEFLATPVQGE